MKIVNLSIIAILLFAIPTLGQETDKLGEDFDLEALPGILEKVSNFEELEKAINEEGNDVNNLDLDGNNEVDYVLIQEEIDGDTHIAFLRIATSETEYQDVATIEIEKQSASTATFQIVGDEALYGPDYILEPEGGVVDISESTSGSTGGKGGPSPSFNPPPPLVRVTLCVVVFRPAYVVFVSPYGFVLRPVWFRPWHPIARSSFRAGSARMHRKSFRRTSHRRSHKAHNMQKKGRKTSKNVNSNKSNAAKKSNKTSTVKSSPNKSTNTKSQQKNKTPNKGGGVKKGGKK